MYIRVYYYSKTTMILQMCLCINTVYNVCIQ